MPDEPDNIEPAPSEELSANVQPNETPSPSARHELPMDKLGADRERDREKKRKRRQKSSRRRGKALAKALAVTLGLLTAVFVGAQIRETWRQSQLTYLQTRSQDFLNVEFNSPSMGCLYSWWTPRSATQGAVERPPADLQCDLMRSDYAKYSKVMLYVEEALMYFVEEARVTCDNGVNYGRELEIWRGDVSEDVTGAFSFYILNRFGNPDLGYSTPAGVRLDPSSSVRRYLEQARLFDVTLTDLCTNAERFRDSLKFEVQSEPWVAGICRDAAEEVINRQYSTENIFDAKYCARIHYIEPTFGRRLSNLINQIDRLGSHLPF